MSIRRWLSWFPLLTDNKRKIPTYKITPAWPFDYFIKTFSHDALVKKNPHLVSVGVSMGMWICQISLQSAYGLHVPHFIVCHAVLGSHFGLDLLSTPQNLGLVLVSLHSGLVMTWSWWHFWWFLSDFAREYSVESWQEMSRERERCNKCPQPDLNQLCNPLVTVLNLPARQDIMHQS